MPTFECPTCREVFDVPQKDDAPFRPFCSKRCKMVDLGRWLDGTYRVSEPPESKDARQTERQGDEPEHG